MILWFNLLEEKREEALWRRKKGRNLTTEAEEEYSGEAKRHFLWAGKRV